MSRSYRHIQEYESEILSLKEQGKTLREISEELGFTYKQLHNFISRYNAKQRKIEAGIALKLEPRDYRVVLFASHTKKEPHSEE